ncbi:porin [Klebsiella pneumoniae]|uniref:porin n=1 Tax=Klebsiella pneumoniae TaxID=573 RepID=UPI00345125C7
MKVKVLSLLVPALLVAGAANAAEIYNKDGNKLDLYGKIDGLHYFSDDKSVDGDQTYNATRAGSLGFANKAQNFEVVAQYQFDFGLRPSVAYLQSKGKDLEGYGDQDILKYVDVGATYYFNKNMSTYVDYKINLLDDNSFTHNAGISTDDVVALGLVYQF